MIINPNRMRPPVAPIALDLLGGVLARAGHAVRISDLAMTPDPAAALDAALREEPLLVAITVRNIDDAHFTSGAFLLPEVKDAAEEVRKRSDRPIVLGGVGYSILPEAVLEYGGAQFGIAGDGEDAIVQLADRLAAGRDGPIPGLLEAGHGGARPAPPRPVDLESAGPAPRRHVDNRRYEREGGMVGFETKRGCPERCIYCVDPVAKGKTLRCRRPDDVAEEIAGLVAAGVTCLHTCDSEFNIPRDHALAVCRALEARGLGERVQWYAYATPAGFDRELAEAMARAGCAGINFGTDHADSSLLRRLGRDFDLAAIASAARHARANGIAAMFDLMLGGPGETRETAARALGFFASIDPVAVGVSWGVRVYPGTPFAGWIRREPVRFRPGLLGDPGSIDAFVAGDDAAALRPVWYLSPGLGEGFGEWLEGMVGGDPRFLVSSSPRKDADYNYNDNEELCRAIEDGARGAYWHILVRKRGGSAV